MQQQDYQLVPVDDVRPHPENPRRGDVDAIHDSIEAHGFYGALVVQRSTGFILAGNHRWLAAKRAGADRVPALFLDVDDETAKRILLADNRTSDLAGYDDRALHRALQALADGPGFERSGYTEQDYAAACAALEYHERPVAPEADATENLRVVVGPYRRELTEPQYRDLLARLAADGVDLDDDQAVVERLRQLLRLP